MVPVRARVCLLLAAALLLAGCHRYLSDTPTIHVGAGASVFAHTPTAHRTTSADVIFVTDRDATESGYGTQRSRTVEFGTATVNFGRFETWDSLEQHSTQEHRDTRYKLQIASIDPAGAFPDPLRDNTASAQEIADAAFIQLIQRRLDQTPSKDVVIFIHGFNNTFREAVFTSSEIWHFMGRVGVPIAYTWPAGRAGLIGYGYDRESGEFTVPHLKRVLRQLGTIDDIGKVHIVAHSRGADILISALREMRLEARAGEQDLRTQLHLDNIIFAAPDIDVEIFYQRYVREHVYDVCARTIIYTSPQDLAIGLADVVLGSRRRMGRLFSACPDAEFVRAFLAIPNLEVIDCQVPGYLSSHDYYYANPSVLSDLILVIRDGARAGDASRPLFRHPEWGHFVLTTGYPTDPREPRFETCESTAALLEQDEDGQHREND